MSLLTPQRPAAGAHTDSAATMVPNQSRAERTTSYVVADFPQPTGREEEWRFTPVDRLGALFRDEPSAALPGVERVAPRRRHARHGIRAGVARQRRTGAR